MTLLEKVKETWNALTNTSGRKLEGLPGGVSTNETTYTTHQRRLPMKSYLKVKIKSLAEEATIIRHEERRVRRAIRWWTNQTAVNVEDGTIIPENAQPTIDSYRSEFFGLHNHRTYEVRNESRASQLAYAFIQGYAYDRVEDPTKTKKPVPTYRIAELALKYGKVNIPVDTPYNNRRSEAEKAIRAWAEGKTHVQVTGTNGQVLRPVQPTT